MRNLPAEAVERARRRIHRAMGDAGIATDVVTTTLFTAYYIPQLTRLGSDPEPAVQETNNYPNLDRTRGVRGYFIDYTNSSSFLEFQFNPNDISDTKTNEYFERKRTGKSPVDEYWVSGGQRLITFTLSFNASPGAFVDYLAMNSGTPYPQLSAVDFRGSIQSSLPSEQPEFRGTLPFIEKLQSFIYPSINLTPLQPRFINQVPVGQDKFISPPKVIFSYGDSYYVAGHLKISIKHKAFWRNLVPTHSEVEVQLTVDETLFPDKDIVRALANSSINAVDADTLPPYPIDEDSIPIVRPIEEELTGEDLGRLEIAPPPIDASGMPIVYKEGC
jgi:hypothetical protein